MTIMPAVSCKLCPEISCGTFDNNESEAARHSVCLAASLVLSNLYQISEFLLGQYVVQSIQYIVYVGFGDDERRLEGHDIASDTVLADDEAAILHYFQYVIQFFRGRRAIRLYEFCAVHETESAYIADDRMPGRELTQAVAQLLSALIGGLAEVVLIYVVEHSQTGGRGDGIAAECRGSRLRVGICDLGCRDEAGYGSTVAEGFGHGHDIRHHVEILDGEHLARAGEAGLHLVADQQGAILGKYFLEALEIALGRYDDAGIALDGLGEERGRVAGRLRLYDILDDVGAFEIALRVFAVQGAAVAVGIRGEMDAADWIRVRAPHADAGQAHGQFRPAVQAVAQSDVFAVAGIYFRQQGGTFIGLSAGRAEERFLQLARCHLGQTLSEIDEVFRQIDVAESRNLRPSLS